MAAHMMDRYDELMKLAKEITTETIDGALDIVGHLPAWYQVMFVRAALRQCYEIVHTYRMCEWCKSMVPVIVELTKYSNAGHLVTGGE